MSPFPGFNTTDDSIEKSQKVISYSDMEFKNGFYTSKASCNFCYWEIEISNVNGLKHIADFEDVEDRAKEHEAWHRSKNG